MWNGNAIIMRYNISYPKAKADDIAQLGFCEHINHSFRQSKAVINFDEIIFASHLLYTSKSDIKT
jgi:hypothetical protein